MVSVDLFTEDVDLYESLVEILSKNHVTESEVEAVAQGDLRSVTLGVFCFRFLFLYCNSCAITK